MKLVTNVELLRNQIGKIISVSDKKNSRPILSYSLFKATPGKVEIYATDLEVSAKIVLEADVNNSGQFCLNAKNLFDILRELPDSEVVLELDEDSNIINLNCGEIHFSLVTYKTTDFPNLIFESSSQNFEVNSEKLAQLISKTSYAISNDETRLFLNGIFFQEVDSKLRAVATDGHRLSLIETEMNSDGVEQLVNGVIVPKKGIFELKKITEAHAGKDINISVDESFLYVNINNEYYLSIRLIAKEYIKYQAVIPNKTTYSLTTDKESLHNAIKRIKIMSHEKSNGIKLKFDSDELTITANHPSLGNAFEKIQVDYEGKEMEIGVNAKYLTDILSSVDDGDIKIELNNEFSPVIIKSENLPNYLGIVMPLKV